MFDYDRIIHMLALRHKGVVTREHAFAEGVPRHVLDRRVDAGVLIVMHDGVYRHAAVPFTQELRDLAAVLACGAGAVLSHQSAAARHRYPNVRRTRPVVTSPHRDLPRIDWITHHRSRRLPAMEITVRDGIPITTKGRTALDFCAVTPLWVAQEVIVEAVITKVVRPEELFAVLDRSGGQGCPGTVALRTIATGLDDLDQLESMLELVVAQALDRARVPPFVRQQPLVCADGRRVRLDFALPDLRIAVEANGRRWHDTPARKKRTRERRTSIVDTGWEVVDLGWADGERPGHIESIVEAAVDRRMARVA